MRDRLCRSAIILAVLALAPAVALADVALYAEGGLHVYVFPKSANVCRVHGANTAVTCNPPFGSERGAYVWFQVGRDPSMKRCVYYAEKHASRRGERWNVWPDTTQTNLACRLHYLGGEKYAVSPAP